ncbi:MAG: HAMP domain-containing histidine kinase [Candidatus Thiodiazotropha lotti]|uniref:histidine kinase n=1 Tax=Candidatus Thiodiazotropha lotti TaxID=2792787 RepID=A0A9E4K2N3_9GAMM|nr:HAMP domain-containing histidine kinase [Candidatus Thiodiazotropha lotti]MCG7922435.1 HAMP domain-containing histidine kinase [Candidatus Thiodiazotropha lotti]MCG7937873.1 HAMP domain-containing histidine kinase [Candidatus Thiodiazotropha lotti]MCG8003528.1 HAMP domain-containing histidine kinase [Candidatus Thiodiazotropha lotti]MCG8009467.1 HAMP domain-containing histidine kinase [Candidatus Thiodiazotropha lotti]
MLNTGFRYGMRDEFKRLAEPHLVEYVDHLQQQIGAPPDILAASALAERLSIDIQINSPADRWSSSGVFLNEQSLDFHQHQLSSGRVVEVSHQASRFIMRLQEGDVTALYITKQKFSSSQLPLIASITIAVVLLLIALTYHFVRRLFLPIETIRQGVANFGSGDLKYRIKLQRKDELGELARSVNIMADEIQGMLEAKRQLLLAISHELRSPLTRVRLNAELIEHGEPRERIIQDLKLLEQQLNELLETERLESNHAKLDLQLADPEYLINSVTKEHFAQSQWQSHFDKNGELILLDIARIKLLIKNLLDNALRHTNLQHGDVEIHSQLTKEGWHFQVTDFGSGIAEEHLKHLTEPFYRADKARQRSTGGYGLGLYLCRVITEAHGGELTIESQLGKGTQVSVTIPHTTPTV